MRKGLGQGLDALFQSNEMNLGCSDAGLKTVRLGQVEPNKEQPRTHFDKEALQELAASINEHGVIQPLIVRELSDGYYQIIAGERRWRAARMAGLTELPVIVRDFTPQEAAEVAMIENLQREDLNPLEEAQGLQMLIKEYALTHQELAKRVGKSRPAVANALRLLALPPSVQTLVREEKLSAGHARALLGLSDPDEMEKLAIKCVEQDLSVRSVEQLVKRLMSNQKPKNVSLSPSMINFTDFESRLSDELGRKVKILHSKNKGKIEIEYYGNEDFDVLMDRILRQ